MCRNCDCLSCRLEKTLTRTREWESVLARFVNAPEGLNAIGAWRDMDEWCTANGESNPFPCPPELYEVIACDRNGFEWSMVEFAATAEAAIKIVRQSGDHKLRRNAKATLVDNVWRVTVAA